MTTEWERGFAEGFERGFESGRRAEKANEPARTDTVVVPSVFPFTTTNWPPPGHIVVRSVGGSNA
jgi:hypothetical protein